MGDPVPEETIKAAEARFGTPLPTPLRQLYQSLGSVNLYWCLKSRLDERTRQRITKRHTNMISDSGLFDGAIRIVALEDMLFDEDFTMPQLEWKEGEEPEFDFAGTVYTDNEFSRMVRHFDAVDNYYAMSFIVQPDLVDWKMMFLGGHWIDADYSRVTYLEDYLRYVIATRGSVHARRELFAEYRETAASRCGTTPPSPPVSPRPRRTSDRPERTTTEESGLRASELPGARAGRQIGASSYRTESAEFMRSAGKQGPEKVRPQLSVKGRSEKLRAGCGETLPSIAARLVHHEGPLVRRKT